MIQRFYTLISRFMLVSVAAGFIAWWGWQTGYAEQANKIEIDPVSCHIQSKTDAPSIISDTLSFDGNVAYDFALDQCNMGPRPTGTTEGWATGDYIIEKLESFGWEVSEQEFTYRNIPIRNVIGIKGSGPIVILGAHYDTRPISDKDPEDTNQPIIGANDGASGVAVLLELARSLDASNLDWQIWLTFFDAEDRGHVDDWPFSVGAEYMADNLTQIPDCMILLDMIGDLDQNIYWEANSNPELLQEIWETAEKLGYEEYFIPSHRWGITDDHIPFIKRGIPAVDLLDFDYPYWHTMQDTCDKIGPQSLDRIGKVVQMWLLEKSKGKK